MADPVITPGKDTSEFWMAKVTLILSIAIAVVGGVVDTIQQVQQVPGVGAAPVLGKVLLVLGVLSSVLVTVLQMVTRVSLKKKALELAASATPEDTLKALQGDK